MKNPTLYAADLFCGAGGTSEALRQICEANKQPYELVAVNHWNIAIDTHSANHPYAKHRCARLESVNPYELVPGGRLKLLIAGIECTHHSNARGGRPRNDQSRSSAWLILKWCSELYVETVIIENVKEFRSWGPLGANQQPMKSKRGENFLGFIEQMRRMGYNVEHRVLCAADYGDPTTRERLFIVAKRGKNRRISWPTPTHAPAKRMNGKNGHLFGEKLQSWRVAREIIDWSNKGRSIFGRPKPLAPKTIERIAAGFRKQGPAAEPFLVMLYGTNKTRSVDRPLPTITAGGNHIGLAEPFLVNLKGKSTICNLEDPAPTVTTIPHVAVVEPFMIGQQSGAAPRSVSEPVPTIATGGAISLVQPFLVQVDQQGSNGPCTRSLDQPIGTVVSKQNVAVVEPFVMAVNHGDKGVASDRSSSIHDPMPTITTNRSHAVVEPFVVEVNHGADQQPRGTEERRTQSVDEPLRTVTTAPSKALVEPFLVKYNGKSWSRTVDEPLDTVTTQDRFGLITTEQGTFKLDIRFRMLTNRELARAQGVDDSYIFTGKGKDVTRQIGNMVPIGLAKAVIGAAL